MKLENYPYPNVDIQIEDLPDGKSEIGMATTIQVDGKPYILRRFCKLETSKWREMILFTMKEFILDCYNKHDKDK